jgi:hypothetical protein
LTDGQREAGTFTSDWYGDADHVEEPEGDFDPDDAPGDDDVAEGRLFDEEDDEPFPTEQDPEAMGPAGGPTPEVRFWVDASGELDDEVRPPSTLLMSDPLHWEEALKRYEKLAQLATALERQQREALLAATLAEAFRKLRRLTNVDLAREVGLEARGGSGVSRNRFTIIEAPFGLVPLAFFASWSPESPERVAELENLAAVLADTPQLSDAEAARRAAETAERADALRKQVRAVRAVLTRPDLVARHRRRFPLTDWRRLRTDLQRDTATVSDRGKLAYCMALVGLMVPDVPHRAPP